MVMNMMIDLVHHLFFVSKMKILFSFDFAFTFIYWFCVAHFSSELNYVARYKNKKLMTPF